VNIGDLVATLRVNDRDYNSSVDQAGRRFGRLGDILRRGTAAAGRTFASLGSGVASLTSRAITPAVNGLGRFRDGFQSTEAAASAFSGRMGTLGGVAQRVFGPGINGLGRFRDGFRSADVAASAFSGRMGTLGGVAQRVLGPGINSLGRFRDGFVSTSAAASAFSGRMGTLGGVTRTAFNGVVAGARGVGTALSAAGSVGMAAGRTIGAGMAAAGSAAVGMGSRFVTAVQNSRSATDGLMDSVKGLAGQLTAFAGIAGIVKIGTDVAGLANQLDNTRRVMEGLYNDTKVAGDMMDRLARLSAGSSLGHQNFLKAGESLAYLGISGERAESMLRNLDAATTVAGSGAQGMESALYALTGATNAGKVQLDHLNQISQAGVPIFNQLQSQFGKSADEVRKMASDGKISVADLEKAFETASGPLWSDMVGASANASASLTNQWATFRGNFTSGMAQSVLPLIEKSGAAFVGLNERVTPFFNSIPELVGKAKAAMDQWGITDALRNIADQMGTIAQVAGPFLTGALLGVAAAFGGLVHVVSAVLSFIAPLTEYLAENEGVMRNLGIAVGVLTGLFLGGQGALMLWRGALMLLSPAVTIVTTAMTILRSRIVTTVAVAVAQWTWLAITATASAIKTGAAWLLSAGANAALAVAQTTAAVVAKLAQWALLGATATLHAIKVGAAWLLTAGVNATVAVAQATAAVAAKLVQWGILAAQATANAVRVAAAWALTTGAAAATAAAQMAAVAARMVAQWVMMAAGAMARAAVMAAAWVVAMGPIGWVTAAVVGLVVLIIANWDRVKAFTQAAWTAVSNFVRNAWNNIVSAVTSFGQRAVSFVQNAWERAKAITSAAWTALVTTISTAIARAISWVAGIPGRVMSALGNIGSLLIGSGRALVDGFLNGIKNAWGRVTSFVRDGVAKVRSMFPFSPAKEGPFSGRGYVTYSGKALTTDFADSLRGGMPNIIASARDIVDAAHGQLNRDMALNGMSLTGDARLPGHAWLSRARDENHRRDDRDGMNGGSDVTVNIHNPQAERSSDSINRSKRTLARLGRAR